jgi:hypothetical protein
MITPNTYAPSLFKNPRSGSPLNGLLSGRPDDKAPSISSSNSSFLGNGVMPLPPVDDEVRPLPPVDGPNATSEPARAVWTNSQPAARANQNVWKAPSASNMQSPVAGLMDVPPVPNYPPEASPETMSSSPDAAQAGGASGEKPLFGGGTFQEQMLNPTPYIDPMMMLMPPQRRYEVI